MINLQAQIDHNNRLLDSRMQIIREALQGGNTTQITGLSSTVELIRAYGSQQQISEG